MNQLTEEVKTQIAITAAEGVAAATALYGATIDCAGFDGLRMCVTFGVLTTGGTLSIKAQQAALANFSDPADLLGTSIPVDVDADDGKTFIIDIHGIRERYARLAVMRATQNSVVQLAWYELYHPKELPVTQHADVHALELHVSPIEGTA
jgi:hypothetical protein